jgi:ATP-dependent Clp protease adaptor protein ClpS
LLLLTPYLTKIYKINISSNLYNSIITFNDDYTTMEFVVEVLTSDFSKPQEEAVGIMLKVHEAGKAVAGIYSLDIAESKILKVTEKARRSGFPLKLTMEPVERSES